MSGELLGAPEVIVFVLFGLVVGVSGFVLWIIALIDAIRVPDDSYFRTGNKVIWVVVIALTGFIGAIIYFAVGRPPGGAPRAPVTAPVTLQGATAVDFRGVRYALGRTADAYAIWDTAAGGAAIRSYPLTDEGWREAWKAYYEELEGAPPRPPSA